MSYIIFAKTFDMDFRIPNIRHLRVFCEVSYTRRISAASKIVHLSQSAVTQAISKLETTFKLLLFDRRPEGMFITEPGSFFLKRVERGLLHVKKGALEALRASTKKNNMGNKRFDRLLTTAQLRSLIAVSETQNFSLAARSIGISQPTLYRSARQLENISGVPLFIKNKEGIALTKSALLLVKHIKLAFYELKQGVMEIESWHQRYTGKITVGCLPIAKTNLLPESICQFSKAYPYVNINIVDGTYSELLHDLRHGDVDFFISPIRDPLPIADVVQDFLFDDTMGLVVRSKHPALLQGEASLDNLSKYPWIVAPKKTPIRDYFNGMFSDAGVDLPQQLVESNSLIVMRSLLQQSDTIALLSRHIIKFEEQFNLLKYLPLDLPKTKRPIGITLRKDWHPTTTQSVFLDILRSIRT